MEANDSKQPTHQVTSVEDVEIERALAYLRETGKYEDLMEELRNKLNTSWTDSITDSCNALVQKRGYVNISLHDMVHTCTENVSLDPMEAMSHNNYEALVNRVVFAISEARDELETNALRGVQHSSALYKLLAEDEGREKP